MCEQERAADEILLGEHDIGRLCGVGGHDRLVLQLGRFGEDVLDVERSRFEPLQLCALGEHRLQIVEVDVGFGRQRDVRCAGGADPIAELGSGDEPHVVAALDVASGNRQQRCDMPMGGTGGDDDRRHHSPSGPHWIVQYTIH
jgi:hypothetical protein